MKRKLLFLILLPVTFAGKTIGQTTAKVNWALNSNRTVAVTGNVTASDQSTPAVWGTTTYSRVTTDASNTVYPGLVDTAQRSQPSGGWPAGQSAEDANQWLEYKVSPVTGNDLTINYIKMDFGDMGSTNVGKANIYYSLDGFQTRTQLNPSVLTLPKYSAIEIWLKSEYNVNIAVPSGSTLSVRVFMYWPNGATSNVTNKNFSTKDVIISGTTVTTGVLPLTLNSFSAKTAGLGDQVKLSWNTIAEVNTKNFVIERKGATGGFQAIGSVNAASTAGKHNYSFVDVNPVAGVNYYRLKEVDKDGASVYTNEVSAMVLKGVQFAAYPNPIQGSLVTVSHPAAGNAKIKVLSVMGSELISANVATESVSTLLDVSKLSPGIYLLKYMDDKETLITKLIK